MAATAANIISPVTGNGGPLALCWFGDSGIVLPTDTTTALAAGFKDAGYVDQTAVDISTNISVNQVPAFGTFAPVQIITTSEEKSIKFGFLETNVVTLALKSRQTLASVSLTAGAVTVTEGPGRDVEWAGVVHAVNAGKIIRKVFPRLKVSGVDNETINFANPVKYGVTMTALPDSNGISVYTYYSGLV